MADTPATWTYVVDEATGERRPVDREAYLKGLAAPADEPQPVDAPADETPKGARK